jgi:putative Mn2+ efflux pump MntP
MGIWLTAFGSKHDCSRGGRTVKDWLFAIFVFTVTLGCVVAISPFVGWYAHLVWSAFDYGWSA